MNLALQLFTLLGSIALFLFGLNLLSGGLQKVAGNGLRSFLATMTSNPLKRILTGLTVTAIIQSSTATTIMVVGFVNAALMTLAQAIGIIMGANIGTTVTSWIMAVFGFSYDISTISYPLIAIGFLLTQRKANQKQRDLGEIIIGFALFFVGFAKLRMTAGVLLENIDLSGLQSWTSLMVGPVNISILLFLLIGTVLTICFQSSAATMAIIMLLITTGVIPFEMAAAMVLGENIGTTIAANIAASVGNTASKRAAMAHTVFNVFGVIWVLLIFRPFLRLVGRIVGIIGLPDPNVIDFTSTVDSETIKTSLLFSVTTMHTLFNITNTLILVWFIPQIEKLVSMIIPSKDLKEGHVLRYISGGPLSTAELSLDAANQEILRFATVCQEGFSIVRKAIMEESEDKFKEINLELKAHEQETDDLEFEIASYLDEVVKNELSEESEGRVKRMYRIVKEMESLGDSCETIGRILKRSFEHKSYFGEERRKKLSGMMDLVDTAYIEMLANLRRPYGSVKEISSSREAEEKINKCRNLLRDENIENIEANPAYNYQTGVFYADLVSELEKIGDFIINISEAQMFETEHKN